MDRQFRFVGIVRLKNFSVVFETLFTTAGTFAWNEFYKFDGKFDFKEIFSQILRQAEIFGRLSVIL